MYYLLFYEIGDDFVDRRTPFRQEHLRLVRQSHQRGELVMSGPLSDMANAVLLFKADDSSVPERFAREDPYVKEGVAKSWRVLAWNASIPGDRINTGAD